MTEASYGAYRELHAKYADRGLVIVAFPCNQFAKQESGTNPEIKAFAAKKGFEGMLMGKIDVNASFTLLPSVKCCCKGDAHPLWIWLQKDKPIAWNFGKFLIARDGTVIKRFEPKEGIVKDTKTASQDIKDEIEKALAPIA